MSRYDKYGVDRITSFRNSPSTNYYYGYTDLEVQLSNHDSLQRIPHSKYNTYLTVSLEESESPLLIRTLPPQMYNFSSSNIERFE